MFSVWHQIQQTQLEGWKQVVGRILIRLIIYKQIFVYVRYMQNICKILSMNVETTYNLLYNLLNM